MNQERLESLSNDFVRCKTGLFRGIESCGSPAWRRGLCGRCVDRPGGGGGRTRVLTAGKVWERGGVNFSQVEGEASPALQAQMNTSADRFWAAGVSLVMHPNNPHVPIVHMNVRHFALSDGTSWFGGGIDLTPHYVNPSEATQFHHVLRRTCEAHACADYGRFKAEADDYFFVPHRQETRGVGGIFFDHMGREGASEMNGRRTKRSSSTWAMPFCRRTCPWCTPMWTVLSRRKSANGNFIAGAVTWSSTWCGTGGRGLVWCPMAGRIAF